MSVGQPETVSNKDSESGLCSGHRYQHNVRNTEVWEQTKLAREQAEPWRSTWLGKADMLKSKEEQATTANRDNKAGC